jgi:dTDP-L-rhamnose 4-epimerase
VGKARYASYKLERITVNDRVLITGGAGFIGSRVARKLLAEGYEVSILDNFSPQIHGGNEELPSDLVNFAHLFRGDVRDPDVCGRALQNQNAVIHLAAETGTGQSMYRVRHYSDVNIGGTSNLMELLLSGEYPVQTLVVASSRAVYGEGAALCPQHGEVYPGPRSRQDMERGNFEPQCPKCQNSTMLIPTPEEAPFQPASLYGLTKQVQEQLVLMYAATLGISGFALRYQNVYGPGQSLKNPYTGILAIFSNQARANEPIYIFEDGKESRDFVFIDDVVDITVRCLQTPASHPVALNVGTGSPVSVSQVVEHITEYFSSNSDITVTGAFREGDIRHNCARTDKLKSVLGLVPRWSFADGVGQFLNWTTGQPLAQRSYEQSLAEMRSKGLMHG